MSYHKEIKKLASSSTMQEGKLDNISEYFMRILPEEVANKISRLVGESSPDDVRVYRYTCRYPIDGEPFPVPSSADEIGANHKKALSVLDALESSTSLPVFSISTSRIGFSPKLFNDLVEDALKDTYLSGDGDMEDAIDLSKAMLFDDSVLKELGMSEKASYSPDEYGLYPIATIKASTREISPGPVMPGMNEDIRIYSSTGTGEIYVYALGKIDGIKFYPLAVLLYSPDFRLPSSWEDKPMGAEIAFMRKEFYDEFLENARKAVGCAINLVQKSY